MYKGFVLNTELSKRASVANSLFCQFKNIVIENIGQLTIIKKDTLPKKYQSYADKCLDLENYTTAAELSRMLGMNNDYISCSIFHKTINPERMKIGKLTLIKLSNEFLTLMKKRKTPFLITKHETYDNDIEIIDMYGLKIGFY